ncbi:GNAT family N-acetyltransferase [Haloarcula argentinensis]|uniref:GNAT family N-acetyltransferase n=1 Tax=Haloarcula argentinensis TaxID=43776 RepID=A0ABU2EY86_HALAR|nr:GNAT family protein [Haloarcula argentinensis]EMA24660.1 acetyltransferase [Haloarcula argentinensis DSM 12282]MDS0253222.1 GNAT family N-acetyltransferase [Haloarcula argentinensis]
MSGPVFIHGERVTLHPQQATDSDLLQRLLNEPQVRHNIGFSEPLSGPAAEDLDNRDADTHFVVCVDDEPVGTCMLHEDHHPWGFGVLGYSICPDHWGNGYATDAVDCLAQYAFQELRLNKLGADCYATNPASARVLEKVGFQQEGRRRDHAFVDGEYVDLLEYGLLADEWNP